MTDLKNKNLISLREATKYCSYSQEYLSLRARNGKLKSVKIGRTWMTTQEWLDIYLNRVEKYKEELNLIKEKKDKINIQTIAVPLKIAKKVEPPVNLPIEKPVIRREVNLREEPSYSYKHKNPYLGLGFIFSLAFVFILVAGLWGINSLENVYDSIPNITKTAADSTSFAADIVLNMSAESFRAVKNDSSALINKIKSKSPVLDSAFYGLEYSTDIFSQYFLWMRGNIYGVSKYIYDLGFNLQINILNVCTDFLESSKSL